MDKFLKIMLYLVAVIQVIVALIVFAKGYSRVDMLAAIALLILPILAIIVNRNSPDLEERRLQKQVNKARLKKELKELEGNKN